MDNDFLKIREILKVNVQNAKMCNEIPLNFLIRSEASQKRFSWFSDWIQKVQKACKSCRSRQELSNEYLLAEIVFDTAENGPLKVYQQLARS